MEFTRWQPLDRLAIALIAVLAVLIGLLLVNGDRTIPYVRNFSWASQQVSASDRAFTITFSRPMAHQSVEQHLNLEPPLGGKFSWSGRKMAYTVTTPLIYGETYKLTLDNAHDAFASKSVIKPFSSSFSTPDPAFAYIGTSADEIGRLIIYDLPKDTKQILTPADLTVLDFRIYSDRSKILFSAVPKISGFINPLEQKLYTVSLSSSKEANKPKLILDSGDFQNLKFDLSSDGKAIVVQRLSRVKIGQYGLWVIRERKEPKSLNNQPGGDFLIAPDNESVAIAQGEGVAILPLEEGGTPLDFLPRFGSVLSFSKDGAEAVMVKYNKDYTRSLFRVTNQGVQTEILKTNGSILSAEFDRAKQNIYGIFTDVKQTATSYQETPYIGTISLKTGKLQRLHNLPTWQRDTKLSLAPDDTALLFNQALEASANPFSPRTKIDYLVLSDKHDEALTEDFTTKTKIAQVTSVSQLSDRFPEILGTHPQWLP